MMQKAFPYAQGAFILCAIAFGDLPTLREWAGIALLVGAGLVSIAAAEKQNGNPVEAAM